MKASTMAIRSAVIIALAGVALGIGMAASHKHTLKAAHGHANLVGWVSLFLFSLFYKASPALDSTRLALAQVAAWTFGAVVMLTGVALIYSGYPAAEPLAAIGSIIVFLSLLIFAWLVFRPERVVAAPPMPGAAPAE